MYKQNQYFTIIISIFLFSSLKGYTQPTYTIPWASQQPAFVFPIYIENGQGERDTIYLGYDPTATGYGVVGYDSDAVFGVIPQLIDTNSFYACWGTGLYSPSIPNQLRDSVHKANVADSHGNKILIHPDIYFHGGTLPLKISWDISTLWSDSLPFGHPSTIPEAQGFFTFYYSGDEYMAENGQHLTCINDYLLITDSVLVACSAKDSVTIYNMFGLPVPTHYGFVSLNLEEWTGILTGVQNLKSNYFNIFPNPFEDFITINDLARSNLNLEIVDLIGRVLFECVITNSGDAKIELRSFSPGMYIINIFDKQSKYSKLIIKN